MPKERRKKANRRVGGDIALQSVPVALTPSCKGAHTDPLPQVPTVMQPHRGQASCPKCPQAHAHFRVQPSAGPDQPVPQPMHLSPRSGFASSPLPGNASVFALWSLPHPPPTGALIPLNCPWASSAWNAHPAAPRSLSDPSSSAGVCERRSEAGWLREGESTGTLGKDLTSGLRELVQKGIDGVSLFSQLFESGSD